MILTREDLHRRVWARPMPKVARDLGVTTGELERLCKTLDVPFPYSGYWRKGAPLDGRPRTLSRARPGRPGFIELDAPEPAPAPRPDGPRPTLTAAAPPAQADAPLPTPAPEDGAPATLAHDVPESLLDRRWSLIHARLQAALASAGHASRVVDGPQGVEVKGQILTWWLREGYTRTRRTLTATEARDPWKFAGGRDHVHEERMTGRLILAAQTKAYGRKVEWRDRARRGRLEDRIDEIVAGFETLADEITRWQAERDEAEARWRAREDRRQAEERRAQAEADRWTRLSRLAAQHEETRRVAAFLEQLRAATGPAAGGDPQLRNWFAWAQDAIDAYDPTTWDIAEVMARVDRPPRAWAIDDDAYDDLDDADET